MRIEIKPDSLDCPLHFSFECGMRERECKDCVPGLYDLVPVAEVEGMRAAQKELDSWREREAAVCPEDFGFDEVIKALRAEIERLREEIRSIGESTGLMDRHNRVGVAVIVLRTENERLRKALQKKIDDCCCHFGGISEGELCAQPCDSCAAARAALEGKE